MATKSIITDKQCCVVCESPYIEWHHCLHGTANRAKAEKYGLKIPLCNLHHTGGPLAPHKNSKIDLSYKALAQNVFEKKCGTREDFRKEFGKSYL